jgi:hypothetical protein
MGKQVEKSAATPSLSAPRSAGRPRQSALHLNIGVITWQKAFIAIVIFVVPLIATLMLWTRVRKLGVILLGLSLAGSLVFV